MARSKLLHVFPSFGMGGQQRRLANLIDGFGEDFCHQVISLDGEKSALELIGNKHVKVDVGELSLKKSSGLSIENIRRLAREVTASKADLLCTYNWGSIEAVLANSTGPKISHIHFEDGFGADETIFDQKPLRVLMRRILLRKSQVVVPSTTLRSLALEKWKLPPYIVNYIPNGIDLDRFQRGSNISQDNENTERKIIVGTIGALRAEKNYGRLVKACAENDNIVGLKIYGSGPERQSLLALAIDSDAELCGETKIPEAIYPMFDIFALSSDTEQMPISLMEAMAMGLPIVSTDVGDVVVMVADENRDFITPLGDDVAFASAIEKLAINAELRSRIGIANAMKAQALFSVDKMIDTHRQLYVDVMRNND